MLDNIEVVKQMIRTGMKECPMGVVDPAVWEQAKVALSSEAPVAQPTAVAQPAPVMAQPVAPVAQAVVAQPAFAQTAVTTELSRSYAPKNGECFTIDDLLTSGGMAVDKLLKIKNGHPFIGDSEIAETPFKVEIDFAETKIKSTIRACAPGGKPLYYHTIDNRVEQFSGRPFAECVMECKRIDPTAEPYMSVDIVMTLSEDVKNIKGEVVAAAGTLVGHTTSCTNRKNYVDYVKSCQLAGADINADKVGTIISFERRDNKAGNIWSVLKFERAKA